MFYFSIGNLDFGKFNWFQISSKKFFYLTFIDQFSFAAFELIYRALDLDNFLFFLVKFLFHYYIQGLTLFSDFEFVK